MTKEGDPSLGRDGSTYQEYIVPAFLTQVKPRRKNQEKAHDHVCRKAIFLPFDQFYVTGDLLLGDVPHQRVLHIRESPGEPRETRVN